jgi:hypothetical protein
MDGPDRQWEELEGTPSLVVAKGRRYAELADAIGRSVTALKSISDEIGTRSLAMDETRKLADTVRESIEKAKDRYRETGSALQTYGEALRTAKDEADPAAERLRTLRSELATAQSRASTADSAVDDLPPSATPEELSEAQGRARTAAGEVTELSGSVTHWEGVWTAAKGDKDRAAGVAVGAIDEVVTGRKTHGLEDGFWDKAGEVWDSVYKVVKVICDVAGILAIFLSWVPILGQVLLALAAVGAILAVIDAAVKWARGDGSFWGVLGAAALAVVTLFGGRMIGAVARYAKARTVVQSTARMTSRTAKLTFGGSVIKSSRKVFAMTGRQRVTQVLASPFVRSSTDRAVNGMLRGGNWGAAFRTAFPNPFQGAGMRTMFGNGDVVDMFAVMNKSGVVMDNVTSVTSAVAATGAYGLQMYRLGENGINLAKELQNGDVGDALKPAVSILTAPFGGPYGSLIGEGAKHVPNPTGNAVGP